MALKKKTADGTELKKAVAKTPKTKKDLEVKAADSSSDSRTGKSISLQPELNIALVGHVDHGKTTLT